MDGLTSYSEDLHAVFSQTEVQRCIIHQIRNSLRYVSWKDRKAFVKEISLFRAFKSGLNQLGYPRLVFHVHPPRVLVISVTSNYFENIYHRLELPRNGRS